VKVSDARLVAGLHHQTGPICVKDTDLNYDYPRTLTAAVDAALCLTLTDVK
jgi:hypothetical protein